MKPRNRRPSFLLTIPAALALAIACDPEGAATDTTNGDTTIQEISNTDASSSTVSPTSSVHDERDEAEHRADDEAQARTGADDLVEVDTYDEAEVEDDEAAEEDLDQAGAVALNSALVDAPGAALSATTTHKNLLVALVGDMGAGSNTRAVYKLIKDEGAHFAIILGDFDYKDSPKTFRSDVNAVLGSSFPLFPVIGNHDKKAWKTYQADFKTRLSKVKGVSCTGDLGVASSCKYRGLHFVLSGIGTTGSRSTHEKYLAKALAADDSLWSLCVWHKNQRDFQAGDKPSDIGWKAFQHCQKDGSIVVMGHEHSYARTRAMTDIGNTSKNHGAKGLRDLIRVKAGRIFSVVSGLGGKGIRSWDAKLHKDDTWWGTIFTSDFYRRNGVVMKRPKVKQAVLFMRFNVDGDPRAAHGYLKSVDGDMLDEFDVVRE